MLCFDVFFTGIFSMVEKRRANRSAIEYLLLFDCFSAGLPLPHGVLDLIFRSMMVYLEPSI